ncbi:TIGR00304 family membrane protein [Archaeoglobus neptunius]|uniref:TIGR00304 family membrane protein n=1 Tax=Archaeoglobus neptunius TaxID=2798580 RepID=UPI0019280925|nr:TIGR00304 family protein [Archaeoglobus neptunius]
MNPFKIFAGLTIVMLGVSLLALSSADHNAEYGGVVIIGPFPIVFSSSPDIATFMILLAIFLVILPLIWRW